MTVSEIAERGRGLREDGVQLLPHQRVTRLRPGRRAAAPAGRRAARDRPAGASPSSVLLAELKREAARAAMVSGGQPGGFLSAFAEMIDASPALRAAWSETVAGWSTP